MLERNAMPRIESPKGFQTEADIPLCHLGSLLNRDDESHVHKDMSGVLPRYEAFEITLGKKLELIGDFAITFEIEELPFTNGLYDNRDDDTESVLFMSHYEVTEDRFVLKTLQKQQFVIREDEDRRKAFLETEIRLLSNISHPNIIKLKATAQDMNSFLVLERLFDTLTVRIMHWKEEENKIGLMFRKKKSEKLLEKKMHIAYDIVAAIEHLTKHGIVHRDIKPCNFAFDCDDTLKLCNFSLARELPIQRDGEQKRTRSLRGRAFKLTAMVGTPRYMAPEVGLGKKYNASCDIYSFALVFAQIMTCRKPYVNYPSKEHIEHCVWKSSYPARPNLDGSNIPQSLQVMLKKAWNKDIRIRPNIWEVKKFLLNEMRRRPFPKKTVEWLSIHNDCPCCQKNTRNLTHGETRLQQTSSGQEPAPFFVAETFVGDTDIQLVKVEATPAK